MAMTLLSRRATPVPHGALASALGLLAAMTGAAAAAARPFAAGADPAYRPVAAAVPKPLPGGGLHSPEEMEAFVDGFVGGELEAYDVAGLTVAVVKDGQLFFAKGYGWADVERQVPVDAEQTLFRPGSVSKLFTWTAVMQLVEQGKLDLDADVNTYLTQFKIPATFEAPITLRHALTHTVGLEDGGIGYLMARSPQEIVPLARSLAEHIARPRAARGHERRGPDLVLFELGHGAGGPDRGQRLRRVVRGLRAKPTSCARWAWRAARSRSRCRSRSRSACRSATASRRARSSRKATSTSRTSAPPARWPPPPPTWRAS